MRYVETLRTVGIFQSLHDEELAQIGELLEERRFGRGAVICREGEEGDALYIVASGRARASTFDHLGREKVLALYSPGDFFGEMALLSGQAPSATVTAVADSSLLVLRRPAFEAFLATNLRVMREMLAVISERQASTTALVHRERIADAGQAEGKVITIFSPKGGVGCTTIAVNLATMLKQLTGKQVALVDASLPFGDVGVMLNLEPRRSIADLLPSINELDAEVVERTLQSHSSGMKVLLAPSSPETADLVTADHMKLILSRLQELYDYVVVDTPPYLHDATIGVLEASDVVFVVTTLELPALKNVKVFFEVAKGLGYPPEKLKLVINREDSAGGIRIEDVEATIGTQAAATIANDSQLATLATNRGVPFVVSHGESQLTYDVRALAQDLTDAIGPLEPGASGKKGLARFVAHVRSQIASAFTGGETAPRFQDILIGLGGVLGAAIVLLFITALIASIARTVGWSFPTSQGVNIMIWIALVIGSFLTVRARGRGRGGAFMGGAIGALCGALVALASTSLALLGLIGPPNFLVTIVLIVFYIILGGIGGVLAEIFGGQNRPLRPMFSAS